MDHKEFQQRLNDVLDRRETPWRDAELRRMADEHDDCAEQLHAAELLFEGVELLDRPQVRPDMAEHVLTAVRHERKRASDLRLWVPLCVTAALLLAAIPLFRALQTGENPEVAQPVQEIPEQPAPAKSEKPDATLPIVASEADYLVQTKRAGEALGEVIWATRYDQLTPAQKEWVERATQEISPVADPMANTVAITVDAVIRTIEPRLPRR